MQLTTAEAAFLTALAREHNQNGCRGPAHSLLRANAYAAAPVSGPGSLAFAYDVVPLSNLLLKDRGSLEAIEQFLHGEPPASSPVWPLAVG